jgi:cation-transporting ATPase E
MVSTSGKTLPLASILASNLVTPFNGLSVVIVTALAMVFWWQQDVRFLFDALGVMIAIVANNVLAVLQEVRAHRAVERATSALRHRVMVVREGATHTLDSTEVVVGDVVVLARGTMLPGDGVVASGEALEVDTSMLTGEAVAHVCVTGEPLMAGSVCVAGSGTVRITRSGDATEAARIGHAASRLLLEASPMQRHINRLFQISFALAVGIAVADVLLRLQSQTMDADSVRHTAAIVLGLIPEGLVLFSTVTFALTMARMAKLGVIVQHLPAVESLASVDAMCFDKTGTLTERQTRVADVVAFGGASADDVRGILAAYAHAINDEGVVIDALRILPMVDGSTIAALQHVPFTSQRRFSAVQTDADHWYVLGAPELLLPQASAEGEHSVGRQLALCTATAVAPDLRGLTLICLVTFDDTTSAQAAPLLAGLDAQHIAVHVLTGDAEASAQRVLRDAGRIDGDGALTRNTFVQARMFPKEKQAYVNNLRAQGHHVAMVGDGVNDVPAMREANVGVAVRGAVDVARHVADIVIDRAGVEVLPTVMHEGRIAMRTIMHIANIFLAKNAVLLAVGLLTALTSLPLLLTPRRGGLIAVLAVAIPSAVLAARSRSVMPVKRPYAEILRYSVMMTLAACVSCVSAWFVLPALAMDTAFPIYVTLLASVLASLPFVDRDKAVQRLLAGLAVSSVLAVVGITVAPDVPPISWIRLYFELPMLSLSGITPVVVAAVSSAGVTVGIHSAGHPLWRIQT